METTLEQLLLNYCINNSPQNIGPNKILNIILKTDTRLTNRYIKGYSIDRDKETNEPKEEVDLKLADVTFSKFCERSGLWLISTNAIVGTYLFNPSNNRWMHFYQRSSARSTERLIFNKSVPPQLDSHYCKRLVQFLEPIDSTYEKRLQQKLKAQVK